MSCGAAPNTRVILTLHVGWCGSHPNCYGQVWSCKMPKYPSFSQSIVRLEWTQRIFVCWPSLLVSCAGDLACGPVHLLLTSAAEIGFAWYGCEQRWVRTALPPLRMLSGPVQHLRALSLRTGSSKLALSLLRDRGFGVHNSWTSKDLYNYLTLPT